MSGFARKVLRNQIKEEIKKSGVKRTMPLSKYRFKTAEEIQKEYAERLTEHIIQTAKESDEFKPANND